MAFFADVWIFVGLVDLLSAIQHLLPLASPLASENATATTSSSAPVGHSRRWTLGLRFWGWKRATPKSTPDRGTVAKRTLLHLIVFFGMYIFVN